MSFAIRRKGIDAGYVPQERSKSPRITTRRLHEWQEHKFRELSLQQWLESNRAKGETQDYVHELAEVLTPMFLFLAAGAQPVACSKTGTLHQRAWVLLYAVRPDLIEGETLQTAADRFGVTVTRFANLLREFQRYVPNYVRPSLHGFSKATKPKADVLPFEVVGQE